MVQLLALTWINRGVPTEPSAEGQAGCRDAVLGPLPVGLGSASGLTRGAGILPTGPRGALRRPQLPSGSGFQSPAHPGRAAANPAEDLPRRDAKQPPSPPRTPHPRSPPSEAPRISRGPLGGPRPSDPAEDCAGQREGVPAREGPAPSPAPHPRCACALTSVTAVRVRAPSPWVALDGRLVAKRLKHSALHGNLSEGSTR